MEAARDTSAVVSARTLANHIESELAARGSSPDPEAGNRRLDRCGGCGGLKHERDHEHNSDRVCRCGGRKRRLLSYLDAVDPERRMTLESLDCSDSTMSRTLEQARRIVSGGRRRGMLLMGLPGRGKTHLMVGMGRALLDRGRDAGYYNVVRLVSRIQDSYSDFGGESRREIVESVASHEVVLLDDLGKEHVSSNVDSIVYELFDALENSGVTLAVSTNVPTMRDDVYRGAVLSERYDEAVRSRLRAICERFVIRGVDHRSGLRSVW
jgi:DNA replication protein DnaC